MKKVYLLLTSIFLCAMVIAQNVPKGMKYQAVARSTNGTALANEQIQLRISLYGESKNKTAYYTEVHSILTNSAGLFDVVIGEGKAEVGSFSKVPWSTEDIWMGLSIKEKNRSEFLTISNSKLLAVPYAFHAATASQLVAASQSPTTLSKVDAGVPSANWSLKGNSKSDARVDKLGTTDYMDLVLVTNNIDRLRITADGNINLKKSLSVGENIDVALSATFNKLGGSTINYGPFTVDKSSPTTLTGTLNVTGATTLKSTLGVDGVTNLNNTLNVNNGSASNLSGTLAVTGATTLSSTLAATGATTLGSTLGVTGATTLGNTLGVTGATTLGSTLAVTGASTLNSSLAVTGVTTLNNKLNTNGQVTINANVAGGEGNKDAYPLRVQGSDQGIAVTVNGTGQNNKNFITFWDASGVKGRIEGETDTEVKNSFSYIWANVLGAFDVALPTAEAIACGVQLDAAEVLSNGAAAGIAAANIAEYNITRLTKLGVAFESGSGDYAEWLEKKNGGEKFSYGDIVGVTGGKISKNTVGADQLMVVSMAPIVLGNMPLKSNEKNFEKVAFMGQVPVKVWGKVTIGDYIIPSGANDGFGYGVSSDNMTFELFSKVVGRAWSSVERKGGLSMVNVVVGLSTNELASKISGQQKVIDDLKSQVATITAYLAAKDPAFKSNSNLPATYNNAITEISAKPAKSASLVLAENSQYLDIMINKAKEICLKNGIDLEKFDQVKRLFNDKKYLIETMQK